MSWQSTRGRRKPVEPKGAGVMPEMEAEGHLRGHVPPSGTQGWPQNAVHKKRSAGQRCPRPRSRCGFRSHLDVVDRSYERHAQCASRARGAMSRAKRTGRVKLEGYFCGLRCVIALWQTSTQENSEYAHHFRNLTLK